MRKKIKLKHASTNLFILTSSLSMLISKDEMDGFLGSMLSPIIEFVKLLLYVVEIHQSE